MEYSAYFWHCFALLICFNVSFQVEINSKKQKLSKTFKTLSVHASRSERRLTPGTLERSAAGKRWSVRTLVLSMHWNVLMLRW